MTTEGTRVTPSAIASGTSAGADSVSTPARTAEPPMHLPGMDLPMVMPEPGEPVPVGASIPLQGSGSQGSAALAPVVPAAPTAPTSIDLPPLSEPAVLFMLSDRYRGSQDTVARDFGLNQDDLSFLNEMDHLVLGGSLPLDGYVRALRGEFPDLPKEKREALIARLLADRFLPWSDLIKPSAQEIANQEKISLPVSSYYAVYVKPLTYTGAAAEVARATDIPLGGQLRERLRDLVMSRSKGIRVDAQVEEQMMRALESGGMGLGREKARQAVLAMNDILSRARVLTEDAYSAWIAEEAARLRPVPTVSTSRPVDEDDKEIAAIAAVMPRSARDVSSVLARSTDALVARLGVKTDDPYLIRRLTNVVSSRLRDVRSRHEVLQTLLRDAKVGGMGWERGEAERVAAQIEDGYAEFRTKIAAEERTQLDAQVVEQARKVEERKQRETEEHARWFQEKVRGKQVAEASRQEMIQRMRIVAQGLTTPIVLSHPLDRKEQARETSALGDLVTVAPSVPVAEARPSAPATAPVAAPEVKISAVSARAREAEAGTMRPRMDDVRVMQQTRFSGPQQELAGLTLAGFRRLAKTPKEAIAQVHRKIELLAQESFERRIEGVRAWQASPLQKTYLELVAEAFAKSTPVNTLVVQKRAAGQDAPTTEELSAILELNGKLHF